MDLAWRDGAPADRFCARISQHAWCGAVGDNPFERRLVARSSVLLELSASRAPRHAPATATRAAFAEECLEVGPLFQGERTKCQRQLAFRSCHNRWRENASPAGGCSAFGNQDQSMRVG